MTYDKNKQRWKFFESIPVSEGKNVFDIEAEDKAGNYINFKHVIFVDVTEPTLTEFEVSDVKWDGDQAYVEVNAEVKDNMPYLRVVLNNTELENIKPDFWEYEEYFKPAVYKTTDPIRVNLELGENVIRLYATDIVGHILVVEKDVLVGKIEALPSNTVIVGGEAFDIRYLNNNKDAQMKLIDWYSQGKEIYIKLNEDRIVNIRGEIVGMDVLPDEIIFYDEDGEITIYKR